MGLCSNLERAQETAISMKLFICNLASAFSNGLGRVADQSSDFLTEGVGILTSLLWFQPAHWI